MATKSFRIEDKDLLRLQTEALAQSRPGKPVTVSELVRRAVAAYLATLEAKAHD